MIGCIYEKRNTRFKFLGQVQVRLEYTDFWYNQSLHVIYFVSFFRNLKYPKPILCFVIKLFCIVSISKVMESPPSFSTQSEAPPLSEDSGLLITSGSFSSDSASGWHHVASEVSKIQLISCNIHKKTNQITNIKWIAMTRVHDVYSQISTMPTLFLKHSFTLGVIKVLKAP